MIDFHQIHKIALFRALQLGDLLCVIPAVRALRQQLPHASITLIGMPWAATLVKRFPAYFDRFEPFPGYPGLPEQPYSVYDIVPFITRMQQEKFDLVLQLQGNGTVVNPLVELFGGRYTAGFYQAANYRPPSGLFMEYPTHVHEICRHLLLMQHLGVSHQGTHLEFPIATDDERAFATLQLPLRPGNYVCIHPGSRAAWRQWPPSAFARMADRCAELGYDVVLTGTPDEMPTVMQVSQTMQHEPLVVAGKTSLGALGVLLRQAKLLLSNCTGVSHIASALGTPGVIISMDGEPRRWGPLNHHLLTTVDWTQTPDMGLVEEHLMAKLSAATPLDKQRFDGVQYVFQNG